MPSSKHKEGVPRAIDEALSRKIPVVATSIGGIPKEYTNGEVYLVEPGDTEKLISGLEEVLFNVQLRRKQIKQGRLRVDRWRQHGSAGHQHGKLLSK
jgi:glycosyltransferase involved in cell wall biosynthesis